MKHCIVTFLDSSGIRHSAEVQADSMYEAAAAALEVFREHDCSPGLSHDLEVQVRSTVNHTIRVKKLKDWADLSAASPRDVLLKQRIKSLLGGRGSSIGAEQPDKSAGKPYPSAAKL